MADVVIDIRAQDNFSGTLGNFGNIITGIKSAIDLAGDAFRAFTGFAMEGLDAIASYERMAASFETLVAKEILATGAVQDMTAALQMAGPAAEELLKWNQELAINSPFTAEGVANALRMAMAYGFTVDEAKRLTEALIDFAAGSGASEAAMEAIARALGQISATGKVTGGDMLQLVNAGLPVAQILAEAFGVTTAEIMAMREKGLLPAKESIEAITTYLETNFAGAAERQANTWAGLMGTFADIKTMGLREFFGGLFEVLQPLAVELSAWLQTEGMDKLSEWGTLLGQFTANIVEKLPSAIARIEELKAAFDTGGLGAIIEITLGEIDAQAIISFLDDLDAAMADGVRAHDWSQSGAAFGTLLDGLMGSGLDLDSRDSEFIPAIADALNRWLLGAVGAVSWEQWRAAATENLKDFFNISELQASWTAVGEALADGIRVGISEGIDGLIANAREFWQRVIDHAKLVFGIASPSTVFMDIGRNIVLGLIAGIGSMFGGLLTMVNSLIDTLMAPLEPVLDLLGIGGDTIGVSDTIGSDNPLFGGGDGTVGGGLGTGTPPGSTVTGGSGVTNNFYGPVYFGDMGQLGYDCPSPHPLMTASSQSLLTTTLG